MDRTDGADTTPVPNIDVKSGADGVDDTEQCNSLVRAWSGIGIGIGCSIQHQEQALVGSVRRGSREMVLLGALTRVTWNVQTAKVQIEGEGREVSRRHRECMRRDSAVRQSEAALGRRQPETGADAD